MRYIYNIHSSKVLITNRAVASLHDTLFVHMKYEFPYY